jgi:hypothetical protein
MKRLGIVGASVLILVTSGWIIAAPVFAHGTCSIFGNAPVKSGSQVFGNVVMNCTSVHDEMVVTVQLQHKEGTVWVTRGVASNSPPCLGQNACAAHVLVPCMPGMWRSKGSGHTVQNGQTGHSIGTNGMTSTLSC